MADKPNPSDPVKPSGRQPRRPRTIDLEATDVSPKPASASSASTDGGSNEGRPDDFSASSRPRTAWLPSGGGMKPMLGAAVVGAVGMLIVLAILWTAGTFGGGSGGLGGSDDGGRIAALEKQIRDFGARPARTNDTRPLDELTSRIDRLEKSFSSPPSPLNDAALANRLASAENTTKTFADDIGNLNRRVEDMSAAVRELRMRAEAITPIDKSEFDAMSNRITALEKAAGLMESEIGKRATVTSDRAVRLALATSALRAAVERGEPFTGELAAARPLAPENTFAALEPFAASGVPSNAALARELATLVPALRNAANATPPESGFFDRMKASAGRLIRIRPAEESSSDDPMAVITRIESRAAAFDVPGALADLAKLPPAVRTPAQAWSEKAEARIKAVTLSRQLAADAIGALGKAAP